MTPSFIALLDTVPGQVTVEVFAKSARMSVRAMRSELMRNAPLAAYFLTVVETAMAEVAP